MSIEDKNETPESLVLERKNEQIPNKEIVRDASKFLEGIKTDSILALGEFSKQIETDRGTISKDTEYGKEALVKLGEVAEEKKHIEEELVDDIILWHGSGFSGITLENLSIDRISGDSGKFSEFRYSGSASSSPEYFGFYTADTKEHAKKYDGTNSMMEQDLEKEFEKECEENGTFDFHEQVSELQYWMLVEKMSYKEAIKALDESWGKSVNPILFQKEFTVDELAYIYNKTDYMNLLRNKKEESNIKSTLYKLNIEKGAKIGSLREVFGDGPNKMIQKLRKEDFDKAREQGYDIVTDGHEYAILNKDVVKKIDKSIKKKIIGIDENTGNETIKYVYPEFENQ